MTHIVNLVSQIEIFLTCFGLDYRNTLIVWDGKDHKKYPPCHKLEVNSKLTNKPLLVQRQI